MFRALCSVSLVAALALTASASSAEPRSSTSSPVSAMNGTPASGLPDPSASSCAPSCRAGFMCVQGACVSACNPACSDGEQCSAEGQCVAKAAPKRVATPPAAPVATSTPTTEPDADAAPPPPRKPDVRVHDGFFLRLALGPSYLNSTWKGGTQDATVSGVGAGHEVSLGGTPLPGLVVGGGSFSSFVSSPTISYAGQSADAGSASLSLFAPFIDWYPSDTQGFHVQGAAGLAYVSYDSKGGGKGVSGTGLGFMAGAGYEIWVAEQWSLGAMFRLQYATPSIKADGMTTSLDTNSVIPALLLGATYH